VGALALMLALVLVAAPITARPSDAQDAQATLTSESDSTQSDQSGAPLSQLDGSGGDPTSEPTTESPEPAAEPSATATDLPVLAADVEMTTISAGFTICSTFPSWQFGISVEGTFATLPRSILLTFASGQTATVSPVSANEWSTGMWSATYVLYGYLDQQLVSATAQVPDGTVATFDVYFAVNCTPATPVSTPVPDPSPTPTAMVDLDDLEYWPCSVYEYM
jgi:hypothetical protein